MDGSATFPIASSALAFSTDSQSEINTFLTASGSCLTETNTGSGCGNTTPTPSLSGSVSASLDKKTGTTSIALSFTQSLDGCSGTLYASHKKNFSTLDRSSKTWSKNVRQLVFTPSGTTNEISSKVKRKAKGALRLFIELLCNGSTITSSEISIRGYGGIKSKSSKKLPMKKYIKKFIKKARRRSG